ncbi:transposase family protein [Streptomyces sp. NPDC090057]|uniref:transposase family protein n=1 Tax=Streptomyces sp. NPDC090057 TaxID=3365935 RepID=UPI0038269D4C
MRPVPILPRPVSHARVSASCWPSSPVRGLKTMADVLAYAEAEGVELRLDGTETQVRRPQAGRPGRRAFVSGKRKQNTIKTTTFSDHQGRLLLSDLVRPGRIHDQTAVRTGGRRRAVPYPPRREGEGRFRPARAGQGVPRPGRHPAEEAQRRGVRR